MKTSLAKQCASISLFFPRVAGSKTHRRLTRVGRWTLAGLLAGAGFAISVPAARAQTGGTLTTMYQFSDVDAESALIQGSDGNFYGATGGGGAHGFGSVFRVTAAGDLTTLHSFRRDDGANPRAALIQASDGNFYGTASAGGAFGHGTIFRMTPGGVLTTLHDFTGGGGAVPLAGLIQARDGNFYGTASEGGTASAGTVFRLTFAGVFTTLHNFDDGSGGARPLAGLIQARDGNFYGTASAYGANRRGLVFRMDLSGSVTVVHQFEGTDGEAPASALLQDRDENFYGTASNGGEYGGGTFFRMTPGGTLTVLYQFNGNSEGGGVPEGALTQGRDGNFYGTTLFAFTSIGIAGGSVFKVTPGGTLTVLHRFASSPGDADDAGAGLVLGSDGAFYGTTRGGGDTGAGTIYRVDSSGALSVRHSFRASGRRPAGSLARDGDGNFYGTTIYGDTTHPDTAFKFSPEGVFTLLYDFPVGSEPKAGFVLAGDGNLYGTTSQGGANLAGTVFRMTLSGNVTTLHVFLNDDSLGAEPRAPLIQGRDGAFYGTTDAGGDHSSGTLFRITAAGAVTALAQFDDFDVEGGQPDTPVTQGRDGAFYGTTGAKLVGDDTNNGTAYRVTADGTLTVLHDFAAPEGSEPNGALIQGSDGAFYGAAQSLSGDDGTIFRMTTAGAVSVLHAFRGADGSGPTGSLVRGSDGAFYGTTAEGGAADDGTIFRITEAGAFTSLASFGVGGAGIEPNAGLTTGNGGDLFGTTVNEADLSSGGTIFRLSFRPVLTGLDALSAVVDQVFSYQIAATNSPASYAVSGLPAGLSVNPASGRISGTPTAAGTFNLQLTAANASGTRSLALPLVVGKAVPVISSALNPPSRAGVAFGYQITASGSPASYAAKGLPAGLAIDPATGKITGHPATAGLYAPVIQATNSQGTGVATLNLAVKEAVPAITSNLNVTAPQGSAFAYQIAATNTPTHFGESGLPAGLTINQTTGRITGKPTSAGVYNVILAAFNTGGYGVATLKLTVSAPPR